MGREGMPLRVNDLGLEDGLSLRPVECSEVRPRIERAGHAACVGVRERSGLC